MISHHTHRMQDAGMITILVLVFAGVFGMSVSALMGYVLAQSAQGRAKTAHEGAFHIAEAGLNYYRWHLAHFPTDLRDGTNHGGPYVHSFEDPETGNTLGQFSLDVSGNVACGILQSVDITSTGVTTERADFPRTVSARYMQPTVAEYAQVFGNNVWFGSESSTIGMVRANGGVRMDGYNNSLVMSAVSSWTCDSSYGCNPTTTQPGVFGAGPWSDLWRYPVETVSFASMGTEALSAKASAQSNGIYLGSFSNGNPSRGYHLIFQSNGTVRIYRVNGSSGVWAYNSSYGYRYSNSYNWRYVYDRITNQSYLGTYNIPAACSLIYSEEKLWVEGVVSGKVSVVAANSGSYNPDVLLMDNITYNTGAGTDGLSIVAEENVLIPYNCPNDMTLNGIFTAVNGHVGRDYYDVNDVGSYATRNSLTILGTQVSSERPGVAWFCGGTLCSGFATRDYYYDAALVPGPPPFTPKVSTVKRFYLWQEE